MAFAVVFFLSRLVVFPFYILYNNVTNKKSYVGPYLGMDILNGFLCVLVCLHMYWMYLIIRMAVKMAAETSVKSDTRSDDESDLEVSDKED